ncbi:MAG TPA: response regulator transcription factor [Bacillales bacterium]
MENCRILVVEDDQDLNRLITSSLKREAFQVEQAYDGEMAKDIITSGEFDLVILDLMIPYIDGLELLRIIRQTQQIPVLILSAKAEDTDKIVGLGLGADDYMTKPFSMSELIARVKAHLRRYLHFYQDGPDAVHHLQYGDLELHLDTYQCTVNHTTVDLTAKEFEILKLLMENPRKVFTKAQIFERVWKEDYITDENTVMVHIRRLRKKIEREPSNPRIIQTVWGIGYKLGEEHC